MIGIHPIGLPLGIRKYIQQYYKNVTTLKKEPTSVTLAQFISYEGESFITDEFIQSTVKINQNKVDNHLKQFLGYELALTRFHMDSIDIIFITFARIKGINEVEAKEIWYKFGSIIESNLAQDADTTVKSTLSKTLSTSDYTDDNKKKIFDLLMKFRNLCSAIIISNMPQGKNMENIRIGIIGELLSYLFARDVQNCDCIFHKLVPDNPQTARHGLDLLTVRFGSNSDQDVVHFWEAKATLDNFASQRNEIIDWFNERLASRVNMVIEAAKMEWKDKYDKPTFLRAVKALARYQATFSDRYMYVGSIAYDDDYSPSEAEKLKFNQINAAPQNRHLVLFAVGGIRTLTNGVFELACKI